ncbi:hypothetical protein L1987_86704 [Smallanthus sonchifolius]|uniref:Uncharacterized protein n=1 Tax=Smallanthus sonchifolius TaxID=185202 RepID=A0ACB8Y0K3_9ASTR|nr:hypothetical protein L1987_86704 [Smallanthus sonchifolius]
MGNVDLAHLLATRDQELRTLSVEIFSDGATNWKFEMAVRKGFSRLHPGIRYGRNQQYPLSFTVRRRAPELIVPAKPTPRELKPLSDIDEQERLRLQSPVIMVYRGDPKMRNYNNPVSVIREALAKLLVFYYPFAGRLKEGSVGKLMVDCPGDGVRLNHTMSDATGLVQFLSGLSEIARGATSPSTLPVWQRELLCSSDRPHVTFTHSNKFQLACTKDDTIHSFFFTTTDISAFRRLVPIHLQRCTTFEVITACLWRCRAIALQPDPEEEMPIIWPVNARKMFNPPLPVGYYGNVLGFLAAICTARDLCNKQLGYALELVMKAKSDVTKLGYITSVSNLMALKARLYFTSIRAYTVSDLTRAGFNAVDFGWGKAVYGGSGKCRVGVYVGYTNNEGESGIVVPVCLSSGVMDRFVKELNRMLAQGKNNEALLEHKLPTLSKI